VKCLSSKKSGDGLGLIVFGVIACVSVCLGVVALVIINSKNSYTTNAVASEVYSNQPNPGFIREPSSHVFLSPATELVPLGEVIDLKVDVSDSITEVSNQSGEGYNLPWTSFDMDVNGVDPVYFSVNNWYSPQAPIRPGGTIHIDLKRQGAIKKVFLKCDKGQSSSVSFYIVK